MKDKLQLAYDLGYDNWLMESPFEKDSYLDVEFNAGQSDASDEQYDNLPVWEQGYRLI